MRARAGSTVSKRVTVAPPSARARVRPPRFGAKDTRRLLPGVPLNDVSDVSACAPHASNVTLEVRAYPWRAALLVYQRNADRINPRRIPLNRERQHQSELAPDRKSVV